MASALDALRVDDLSQSFFVTHSTGDSVGRYTSEINVHLLEADWRLASPSTLGHRRPTSCTNRTLALAAALSVGSFDRCKGILALCFFPLCSLGLVSS